MGWHRLLRSGLSGLDESGRLTTTFKHPGRRDRVALLKSFRLSVPGRLEAMVEASGLAGVYQKGNAMSSNVKWSMEADYLQACNCDYGCPCEFSAPPTKGYCDGVGAWRIRLGNFGDVPLDGLLFGFAAHWPKAIHEGNGTVCLFFDERADARQRQALLQIASGQAGGLPFEIIVTTFSKVLEPRYVPFQFNFQALNSSLSIGTQVAVTIQAIKNPVTGEPEQVRVEHGTGFMFQQAECASAEQLRVSVEELNFSCSKTAAFVTHVRYANS